jgi:N-methylhydantoinase B/oxoprolinase/acetone carboxylase alpha subunit
LTSRRVKPPYGLKGGDAGAKGLNLLLRPDQPPRLLGSRCEIQVQPGDRLRIETPGGGGWGRPRVNSGKSTFGKVSQPPNADDSGRYPQTDFGDG